MYNFLSGCHKPAFLVPFCGVIFFLTFPASASFKEDCEKSGGRVSFTSTDVICYHTKRWSPPFGECETKCEPSIQLLTQVLEEIKKPASSYGFDELLKEYSKPDQDICDSNRTAIRRSALTVLNQALKAHKFTPLTLSKADYSSKKAFDYVVKKMWGKLLTSLAKSDKLNLNDSKVQNFIKNSLDEVEVSLDRGVIPLPVGKSEGVPVGVPVSVKDPFNFTSLKDHFFLGVFPVSTDIVAQEKFFTREEHPLRGSFLFNSSNLANHDLQHARALSRTFIKLGVNRSESCHQLRECLTQLPDIERPELRKALYYLFHEDSRALLFQDFEMIDRKVLLESAIESAVNKRVGSARPYSLNAALGDTPEERNKFCHVYRGLLKQGPAESESSQTQSITKPIAAIISKKLYLLLASELGPDPEENSALIPEARMGVLNTIGLKCILIAPDEIKTTPLNQADLDFVQERLGTLVKNGLPEAIEGELKKLLDQMKVVRNNFAATPACQKLFNFKTPSLIQTAADAEDWDKVKDLAEKAPSLLSDRQERIGTILHQAVISNKPDVLQHLLTANPAAVKVRDDKGRTPEDLAKELGRPEIQKLFK